MYNLWSRERRMQSLLIPHPDAMQSPLPIPRKLSFWRQWPCCHIRWPPLSPFVTSSIGHRWQPACFLNIQFPGHCFSSIYTLPVYTLTSWLLFTTDSFVRLWPSSWVTLFSAHMPSLREWHDSTLLLTHEWRQICVPTPDVATEEHCLSTRNTLT